MYEYKIKMFSFFSRDSTVYQKLTVERVVEIQKAFILYYTLINKCNVQPTIHAESL